MFRLEKVPDTEVGELNIRRKKDKKKRKHNKVAGEAFLIGRDIVKRGALRRECSL